VIAIILGFGLLEEAMTGAFFSSLVSPSCWMFFILCPVVSIVPVYVLRYIARWLRPSVDSIIREKELLVIPHKQRKMGCLVRLWDTMIWVISRKNAALDKLDDTLLENGREENIEHEKPEEKVNESSHLLDESVSSQYSVQYFAPPCDVEDGNVELNSSIRTGFAFNYIEGVDTGINRYNILDISDIKRKVSDNS
jgi:hypothetical protein